ncbi:hypothetical protein [Allorhodopirellula solitaria]|uniref:Secreted protein n=1 Tax=Allorhodopirellula solitaria TaxID=2527987 RepID=A0A5C5XRW2_9BACT|nr:hypothetical protein [Allorhodopirellula solitaria]TWT65261.1 hypothetical protein CA85_31730 [Allorhodopirellula solitaria]
MIRSTFTWLALLSTLSVVTGCGSSDSKVVTEGVEQSEIEKYNEMVAKESEGMTKEDSK